MTQRYIQSCYISSPIKFLECHKLIDQASFEKLPDRGLIADFVNRCCDQLGTLNNFLLSRKYA